jgi:hypothetical protein
MIVFSRAQRRLWSLASEALGSASAAVAFSSSAGKRQFVFTRP